MSDTLSLPVVISSVLSVAAITLSITALARNPQCPTCVTEPPSAPAMPVESVAAAPALASDPAPVEVAPPVEAAVPVPPPAPEQPTDRARKLALLRGVADQIGIATQYMATSYPATLPAKLTERTAIAWDWIVDPDRLSKLLEYAHEVDKLPAIAEVDGPARAFLAHVDTWMPRWAAQARYFARGDFHDDDLAQGRTADETIRPSLAEASRLYAAFAAALEPPWRAEITELASRAPGSDLAAFDRAWEGCRVVAMTALSPDLDRAVLGAAISDCRAAADALRTRHLSSYELPFIVDALDQIASAGARMRRKGENQRRSIAFLWSFNAQLAQQMRPKLSSAQAEQSEP